jgi:hypothetical protein
VIHAIVRTLEWLIFWPLRIWLFLLGHPVYTTCFNKINSAFCTQNVFVCFVWFLHLTDIFPPKQSHSYVTTDCQSASQSWCEATPGAQDETFVTVRQLRFEVVVRSLSDERTDLSFTAVIVSNACHLYLQFYMSAFYIVIKSPGPCGYPLFTRLLSV